MKKIFLAALVLFASISFAKTNNDKIITVSKTNITDDICSITYTIKETIGGTVFTSEYTLTATTCEEVESAATAAGIIKPKKVV